MTAGELYSWENACVEGEEGICVCVCEKGNEMGRETASVSMCAHIICTCMNVHLFHFHMASAENPHCRIRCKQTVIIWKCLFPFFLKHVGQLLKK